MIPSHIIKELGKNSLLAMGYSSPNPPVAAVIADLNDKIISVGSTQKPGSNHAEREAYENSGDLSNIPHNIYITLEPCSHYGRTPPCVDLIIKNRPKKVYIGLRDPNPLVRKRNPVQLLSDNSIEVIFSNEIGVVAEEFLSGFIGRISGSTPKIFMKTALSKEGYFKSIDGTNIRLSDEVSNNVTQFLRQSVDAIIVGPNTVFIDSPLLNYRGISEIKIRNDIDSIYFKFLNFLIKEPDYVVKINQRDNQPLRMYCISERSFPKKIFFDKIRNLEKSKTIFIILEELETEKLDYLRKYSDNDLIFKESERSIPDLIFSKFILNSILVEGGNLLYSEFGRILQKKDCIFEILSKYSIKNGSTPDYNNKKIFVKEEFQLNNDMWIIKGV